MVMSNITEDSLNSDAASAFKSGIWILPAGWRVNTRWIISFADHRSSVWDSGGREDTPKMRWAMVSLIVGKYVYRGIVSFESFS
jgi:hypothetical protein